MEYLIITFVIISENIEGEQAPLYFYKFISFGLFRNTFQLGIAIVIPMRRFVRNCVELGGIKCFAINENGF